VAQAVQPVEGWIWAAEVRHHARTLRRRSEGRTRRGRTEVAVGSGEPSRLFPAVPSKIDQRNNSSSSSALSCAKS
jgi:hypothetical protein